MSARFSLRPNLLLAAIALLLLPAESTLASRGIGVRATTAPAERGERFPLARVDRSRQEPQGVIAVEIDRPGFQKMLTRRRVRIADFPLPDRVAVDLELSPFELLSADARVVIVDERGEREAPRPLVHSFRGSVVGDPESQVTLSIFEGRLSGSIRTWEGEYIVAPREYNLAREGSRDIRVWNSDADPDQAGTRLCDVLPDAHRAPGAFATQMQQRVDSSDQRAAAIDAGTMLKASIAIDATYEWYNHFGSVSAAQNYILALMAQVATIYENEVLIQLEVPFLRIHTTASDPYTDTTDTGILLDDLRDEWNANQVGTARSSAHLFSVRPSGGSGLAYVDVLCNNNYQPGNSYDYGVSTLSAGGGSWEKNLVAHEIGHNFSSPHTHCYSPEIDECANQNGCYQGTVQQSTGTIMSYCSSKSSSFHPRVEDEQIRPAAEAAFPTCVTTAGRPGRVAAGNGVKLSRPDQCPSAELKNDDGSLNQYFGYSGTSQMAWIKRFTPTCFPFLLEQVEVQIGHSSTVAVGRAVRVLVYADPQGSGDPATASLIYSEDAVVQTVSNGVFNQYPLAVAQTLTGGDYYIGLYDLEGDATTNYIANIDSSTAGDSYRTGNSTNPQDFSLHDGGTWMIRGVGGAVGAGSLMLEWGAPCNDATTPSQDFAIYSGTMGDYANYSSMTCSTERETRHLAIDAPDDSFFLVVPNTTASEGGYGTNSDGLERAPALSACKGQDAATCP